VFALSETLARAKAYQSAGRLREAEQSYREILQADSAHVETLYLLGAICHALGKPMDAIVNLEQAVRLKPDFAEAHNYLGIVLAQQGRLDEAETCHRTAMKHRPNDPVAHGNLGNLLRQQGKLDQAAACYQRLVDLDPNCAEAHNDLGVTRQQQQRFAEAMDHYRRAVNARPDFVYALNNLGGLLTKQNNLDEAVACYRRALAIMPDYAEAHYNLGMALAKQAKLDEAVACYHRALAIKPDYAEAQNNLAIALMEANRLDEAVACYRQSLALRPEHPEAHCNLGLALSKQNNLDEAVACYRRALAIKSDFAQAHNDLGVALVEGNRLEEAVPCYRRALELKPEFADAHYNLAIALLLAGQWAEGWTEFEWRWKCGVLEHPAVGQPLWTGDSLAGRTILLHCEQGFGDTLQYIRYAQLVKQQGGRVIVSCPLPLTRLLARCAAVDRVLAPGERLANADYDVHAPLLSLPRIFGTTLETVPARVPYLSPDPDLAEQWKHELGENSGLKIGIAWQGNPNFKKDRARSIPLLQFAGIARTPGVRVYSLQMGVGREQLARLGSQTTIIDLGDRLGDFHNTAAIVRNLDLVISSDSAPVHLAGALAVPVWVPIAFAPYWTWMLDREDNPWYPTMRLFRQRRPGDWSDVFARLSAELQIWIAERV
jgi:tetratricopeptide (TPR) repeat protein